MLYYGSSKDLKRTIDGNKIQNEMKEVFKRKVYELKQETEKSISKMSGLDSMFKQENNMYDQVFKLSIVGLQTQEEFLKKKKKAKEYFKQSSQIKHKMKNEKYNLLSFHVEKKNEKVKVFNSKINKNPNIDTSFLPDKKRDKKDELLKQQIRKEWRELQKNLKKQEMEITFSFWDGSNHRRTIRIERGTKIVNFLEIARKELSKNFSELRNNYGSSLMLIKDDLIIPHSYCFQDLISVKSIGLSKKELFVIEEWEDVENNVIWCRDIGKESKIVTRKWYEHNKHIYPGNKWVIYDPMKHNYANI